MPAKRKKDREYSQLRAALEQFLDIAEGYRLKLEAELAAARVEPKPYDHLLRALERQIGNVRKLELVLDQEIWPALIELANVSAYVEHARTRDFF